MSGDLFEKTNPDCLENKSLELERSCANSRDHDSGRKSLMYVEERFLIFVVKFKISSAIFPTV